MNKRSNIIALLLLCSLIITACAGEDAQIETDTSAESLSTATVDNDPEPLGLPGGLNLNGYEYRIFARSEKEVHIEEENGNIVDDAMYRRELTVEELLNCEITTRVAKEKVGAGSDTNEALAPILAGDDEYDIVLVHSGIACRMASAGAALDWNTIENLDLERSWWNQDVRESLEIAGKLYAMTGGITLQNLQSAKLFLFSQPLLTDYKLEYPYQLVRDGKWTWDIFEAYVKNFSQDLNGDGKLSLENDLLGFAGTGWGSIPGLLYTTGSKIIKKNDEGLPVIDLYNERTVDLYDKLFSLLDSDCAELDLDGKLHTVAFKDKRLAFYDGLLNSIVSFNDLEMNFGVVPYPKYDESVDRYYQLVDGFSSLAIIPVTVKDSAVTGAITEAFAYYGHKTVFPAYYDNALLNRYVRDEDSVEMIEIIRESMTYDLAYNNSTEFGGMFACPGRNISQDRSYTFTTFYNSFKTSVETLIAKSTAKYLEG